MPLGAEALVASVPYGVARLVPVRETTTGALVAVAWTFANAEARRLLAREEAEGTTLRTGHAHDDEALFALCARVLATGEPETLELPPAGTDRASYLEVKAAKAGEAVLLAIGDVTALVESRRRAELLEQRFRSLAFAVSEIVWEVDPRGEADHPVPSWQAYTGQTFEQTRGFGWLEAIHPEDRAHVRGAWTRASSGSDTYHVEYRLRRHDGVYRLMLARGVPARSTDGRITGWMGVNVDMTDARGLEADHGRLVEELARANAFLAKVIDSVPVGIALFDPELRITHVNRALAEQNRVEPEHLLGRGAREIFHADPASATMAAHLRRVRDTGHAMRDVEVSWVTSGVRAQERFGLASYFPVTAADETTGVGMVVVDLTERRRSERGLDFLGRAGSLLGSALDIDAMLDEVAALALPEFADWCVILVARDGEERPVVASAAHVDSSLAPDVRKLFGEYALPPDAPIGWARVFETHAPILVEHVDHDAIAKYTSGDVHRELASRIGMESLLYVPVEERGRPCGVMVLGRRDPSRAYAEGDLRIAQQVAHHVGAALANARLFRKVEASRARTERLQSFTAALSSARTLEEIVDVVAESGCAAFGAARAAIFQRPDGAMHLRLLRTHGVPSELARSWEALPLEGASPAAMFLRGESELTAFPDPESFLAQFPGAPRPSWMSAGAVVLLAITLGGRRIGVLGLGFDGPKVLTEDDRADLLGFARLCSQAMDRGLLFDMAQRERRRAEEASQAKDQFLAMVSHELRTPLNAVLGWVALLRDGQLASAQQAKALETIERNARTQTQLIEDLLDVTRANAGKLRISTTPTDPVRVLDAAIEAVLPAAEAKLVRVERRVEWDDALVSIDPARFQQVVGNLLSNAVKFSSRGGDVCVTLSARGGYLVVEVVDGGKGISAEFLPHVFDAFRQADASSTRRHQGLGLGLTIVRQIAELHGGDVFAESEGEGKGARFRVRVPLLDNGEAATELRALRAEGDVALPSPPDLAGVRVLVVDDDQEARALMSSVLSSCKLHVRCVSSAEEAVDEVRREVPDVLISDIAMPGEDGYSLIGRLRSLPNERGARLPAVALTAHARMEDRMRAILAGFDTHVAKPVEPAELVVVLASLLSRSHGQRVRV